MKIPLFWIVLRKEILDARRDRRTLYLVLFLSLLQGPLILYLISALASEREHRVERREVYVANLDAAPSLRNFLERQAYVIRVAPPDVAQQLKANRFDDAVVVVDGDFDQQLQHGERGRLEVLANSGSRGSETARSVVHGLLEAYTRERIMLVIALRGVSGDLLSPVEIDDHDLASATSRAAHLTGALIPLYVLLAVLAGAMNAAMDTTAGERERQSLEPLMMNPAGALSIATGKWLAVTALGLLVALLTSLSYLPAQVLLHTEQLQATFQFGLTEALRFALICVPFAAAVSAALMATSIRGKSMKEAQAGNSAVMTLVLLLPLISLLNDGTEPWWCLWVPSLAQQTLMLHALKGEPFTALHWLVPTGVSAGIAAACLAYVNRRLRTNAVK